MKCYAIIENEETKQCCVGVGTDSEYYESIGMTLQDVEQGSDGSWYLLGYAPKPSFEKLQSKKLKEITSWRDEAISKGIEWNGYIVDTDEDAQRMLTALMVKIQTYKQISKPWTPEHWRLKDGSYTTLAEEEAISLAVAVSDYVSSCYTREAELVSSVKSAESEEELDSLKWES